MEQARPPSKSKVNLIALIRFTFYLSEILLHLTRVVHNLLGLSPLESIDSHTHRGPQKGASARCLLLCQLAPIPALIETLQHLPESVSYYATTAIRVHPC